ncbi:carboxyl-terminal-processing peptidase 1, chloroplastic isoform X1 [Glycine max]|uniref:carboxyl-terminal-processing peptidase 1, chloroplastic isoform X1 n=1 Tax=Glycine max TaxID=3847 RepID=UPI001B3560D4|nr:carboxyl-terminal-processing peptidase 1, chloroplastic isoform X1 [Glycine max]
MSGYATAPSVSASHRSRGCHQRRPRGGSMGDCQRHLSRHRWSQDTWQHLLVPAEEGNYFEQFHSDKIITRMLSSLADPYTRFLSPREFSMMARYDMTGVGINLKEVPDENGDLRLEVLGIILDGPAHSAGVRQVGQSTAPQALSLKGIRVSHSLPFLGWMAQVDSCLHAEVVTSPIALASFFGFMISYSISVNYHVNSELEIVYIVVTLFYSTVGNTYLQKVCYFVMLIQLFF